MGGLWTGVDHRAQGKRRLLRAARLVGERVHAAAQRLDFRARLAGRFPGHVVDGSVRLTWEMHILNFERDAWVKHVLAREEGPDVEGYLAARLSTAV